MGGGSRQVVAEVHSERSARSWQQGCSERRQGCTTLADGALSRAIGGQVSTPDAHESTLVAPQIANRIECSMGRPQKRSKPDAEPPATRAVLDRNLLADVRHDSPPREMRRDVCLETLMRMAVVLCLGEWLHARGAPDWPDAAAAARPERASRELEY
jgi:hypothetical protein